jgi:mRNA-degrading endonuclease toxin of MazEF toxin-antitoxin module
MIHPGELYWAKLPQVPRHPVLVISRESLNRGSQIVVAMLTSARFEERRELPNCVPLRQGSFGLTRDCVVHAQAIFSLELSDLDLDDGPFGIIDEATMRDVIHALGYVFDAECEPT